jgi:pyruvate/2-oxoglutarate dehydrogenase complex dihydrolipoamide acyltransferase (E2) component
MARHPITVPTDFADDDEIELTSWLADDGALVQKGEAVVEVSTAKAEVAIEAPVAGRLRHEAEPGQLMSRGDVIGRVDDE